MWGNKVSNQTATRRTAQTRVTYAVLVLCGVTATAAIHAISQPAETPPNTARFEVTSVNTPVIVRGTSGAQTITVQNKGPDAATGTQALIRPSTSTGITIASVTWGASNTPCTFSSPDYTCSVGGVANNASFDITVTYNVATTATASTSVKQTEIRVKSNEFNPGSGAGETIHKVWGALNQENPATEFGAFWAGRTSNSATCNGRGTTCGTFAGENTIRANLGCKHMKGLEKMSVVFQDKFANTPKNTTGESWQQTSTSCKPFQRVLNNSRLKQAHSAVPEKSRIPPN